MFINYISKSLAVYKNSATIICWASYSESVYSKVTSEFSTTELNGSTPGSIDKSSTLFWSEEVILVFLALG